MLINLYYYYYYLLNTSYIKVHLYDDIHHKFKDDRMMSSAYILGENSSPEKVNTPSSLNLLCLKLISINGRVNN